MDERIWEQQLTNILPYIPPYGKFLVRVAFNSYLQNTLNQTGADNVFAGQINIDLNHFLVSRGFSIVENDAFPNQKKILQLTDRGRELKRIGSYQAYLEFLTSEEQQLQQRQTTADQMVRRQYITNAWIAVGTSVAALYYILEIVKAKSSLLDIQALTALLLFLTGLIAGIIICLLILHLSNQRKSRKS